MRIAVLASGTGSILGALIAADLPIALVLVDRHCDAEKIAEHAEVPYICLERTDYSPAFDRDKYTDAVVTTLRTYGIDLVAMAGFGTVLGSSIHAAFPDRILNTHPALLPAFKGWHAVRDALEAGVAVTGCTVHLATLEVDEGPILAQDSVPVLAGDTEASLHERIKLKERELYPAAIREYAAKIEGNRGADT